MIAIFARHCLAKKLKMILAMTGKRSATFHRNQSRPQKRLRLFTGTVLAGVVLLVGVDALSAALSARKDLELDTEERTLPFVQNEVLFAAREGKDPQAVLSSLGLEFERLQRVHSIKPAVAKYKRTLEAKNLNKDNQGSFWFRGKHYKSIDEVPDDEVFQEAMNSMSPHERAIFRDNKITFSKAIDVQEVVSLLQKNPDVEYAQPNYRNVLHQIPLPAVSYIPNDPFVEDDLNPSHWKEGGWGQAYPDLWGLLRIQAVEAWNEITNPASGPGKGVTVAVVDTGVWQGHPDLASNIFQNDNDPPGDANGDGDPDDDGNGLVDDTNGWDFSGDVFVDDSSLVEPDNDPAEDAGHGTHCAGTIAAVGNNGTGVVGVAPNAKILPVKIFPNSFDDVAAQAIRYAADFAEPGRHVVLSCSWGPGSPVPSKPTIERAID